MIFHEVAFSKQGCQSTIIPGKKNEKQSNHRYWHGHEPGGFGGMLDHLDVV